MVRMVLAADDSLAAMRARSRFGIAIAAMIKMIATTISNSISDKPFCFRILFFPQSLVNGQKSFFITTDPLKIIAILRPQRQVTIVRVLMWAKACPFNYALPFRTGGRENADDIKPFRSDIY